MVKERGRIGVEEGCQRDGRQVLDEVGEEGEEG